MDLGEIRALMDEAFEDFDEADWKHALGGEHLVSYVDGKLIGHACVVPRTLRVGETPLRTGYVEAVAVHPDYQGQGHGFRLMTRAATIIEAQYDLGALCAGERAQQLYRKLGWRVWLGPTYVDSPLGRQRTEEEDGGVMVLTAQPIDLTQPISCDYRSGDVW